MYIYSLEGNVQRDRTPFRDNNNSKPATLIPKIGRRYNLAHRFLHIEYFPTVK